MEVPRATASECTATLPQTKKPQRKFIVHLLGLLLMLPWPCHVSQPQPLQCVSRAVPSRGGTTDTFDSRTQQGAITQVMAPEHQQALVIDASFIPKSGTHTYGLERFWNSRQRRSEKGLEVSAIAGSTSPTTAPMASVSSRPPKRQDLGATRHTHRCLSGSIAACGLWPSPASTLS